MQGEKSEYDTLKQRAHVREEKVLRNNMMWPFL